MDEIKASLWYLDNNGYRVVGQGLETPLVRIGASDEVEKHRQGESLEGLCPES